MAYTLQFGTNGELEFRREGNTKKKSNKKKWKHIRLIKKRSKQINHSK